MLCAGIASPAARNHQRPTTWNMTRHATFTHVKSRFFWSLPTVVFKSSRPNQLPQFRTATANFPHRPSVFRRNTASYATPRETQSWLFFVAMGLNLGTSEVKPGCPFLRQHSSPLLANSRSPNATSTLGAKLAKSDRLCLWAFSVFGSLVSARKGCRFTAPLSRWPSPTEFFPTLPCP